MLLNLQMLYYISSFYHLSSFQEFEIILYRVFFGTKSILFQFTFLSIAFEWIVSSHSWCPCTFIPIRFLKWLLDIFLVLLFQSLDIALLLIQNTFLFLTCSISWLNCWYIVLILLSDHWFYNIDLSHIKTSFLPQLIV